MGLRFMSKMMKFNIIPRIWLISLMVVNLISLYFIDTLEGKIVLGVFLVSAAGMIIMEATMGFVRLLGLGHIFWLGLLPWLVLRLPEISPDTLLYQWIIVLIAMNAISVVLDIRDVTAYLKGDREPYID